MSTPFSLLVNKFHSSRWLLNSLWKKYRVNAVHIDNKYKSTSIANNKFNDGSNPLKKILDTVPPESAALSPSDTLNIFRQLCETSQKPLQSSVPFSISEHENFAILRQAIKVSLPYLSLKEKFEVLKAIDSLSLPGDDEVFDAICSYLLDIVYNMSLNELMLCDVMLSSKHQNEMIKELRRSLIDRFNVKASQMPVEMNFYIQLRRMLKFIERNRSYIIDEVYVNIRNCAAKQRIDIFTAYEALDAIILVSSFGDHCEYFQAILNKSFDVFNSSEVDIKMVEIVLTYLVKRLSTLNQGLFNDTRFTEKCARVAIDHGDLEKGFTIQRQLNRLNFSSRQLIDHLLNHLNNKQIKDSFMYNCIAMCAACDIANYKPPQFDDILLPRLSTLNFHQQFDLKLNWPNFALQMHRLGIYHKPLIEAILKDKSRFKSFNDDSIEVLEVLYVENILNAPVSSSLLHLKSVAGVNLRLLIRAGNDAIIPLLVKMDVHSKNFVPFEEGERDSLRSIKCDDNQCLIALVTPSTLDVRYLRPNLITLPLNPPEWTKLLQHQSIDAFFSDICNRVQNERIKQEATSIVQ